LKAGILRSASASLLISLVNLSAFRGTNYLCPGVVIQFVQPSLASLAPGVNRADIS